MKRILILLFVAAELISYGQAKIGMSPVLSFTPVSATTPSSTVNYSTSVNFVAYVKNYGTLPFTGSISIRAKRDTTFGVGLDSSSVSQTLLPNDSVSVVLSFTPSQGTGAFIVAGNGNTIVVWPYIISGTAIQGDSVRTTIWLNNPMNIFEFEKNQFKLYPNPVTHDLTIKPLSGASYKNIIIYDVFARKVKELSFKETINVSDLTAGSYWMIISSEEKSYRVNFIKQ